VATDLLSESTTTSQIDATPKIQRNHTSAIQFNAQLLNPGVVFIGALVHKALLLNLANNQKNDQWLVVTHTGCSDTTRFWIADS